MTYVMTAAVPSNSVFRTVYKCTTLMLHGVTVLIGVVRAGWPSHYFCCAGIFGTTQCCIAKIANINLCRCQWCHIHYATWTNALQLCDELVVVVLMSEFIAHIETGIAFSWVSLCYVTGCQPWCVHVFNYFDTVVRKRSWLRLIRMMSHWQRQCYQMLHRLIDSRLNFTTSTAGLMLSHPNSRPVCAANISIAAVW